MTVQLPDRETFQWQHSVKRKGRGQCWCSDVINTRLLQHFFISPWKYMQLVFIDGDFYSVSNCRLSAWFGRWHKCSISTCCLRSCVLSTCAHLLESTMASCRLWSMRYCYASVAGLECECQKMSYPRLRFSLNARSLTCLHETTCHIRFFLGVRGHRKQKAYQNFAGRSCWLRYIK